ncbi:MAG: nitrogen regulation protein NR(I) [Burkholderiales bacterium]|nr:nitrogen regulation protein NR(I) [Burkholderiales bacterium]
MKEVWVVDDDRSIRWVLQKALQKANLPSRMFEGSEEVLEALKAESPSVLLTDIRMPGKTGLELLAEIKQQNHDFPVIIMTAFSDLDSAVSSYQGGAFEYLPKPFDIEKAIELIRRAVNESSEPEEEASPEEIAPEIIGKAPAMQEVFRAIGKLSQSSVTVLLTGESGTGKEVVARALHRHSPRGKREFIAINMAAIPRELMESELFGHEKGAFTGANSVRHGRFEQAEGGTLFLDEIGDMPFELQTRLLRVLSDGFFYRVGGHQPIKANVRVIAATHQNLEQMVREGSFREDLYHRLNVIRLRLPPLRERKSDIPLLVGYFLNKSAKQLNVEPKKVSKDSMACIESFPFPGNVRQLENLCNWLTVMAPAQMVMSSDLPEEFIHPEPLGQRLEPLSQLPGSTHEPVGQVVQDWQNILYDEVKTRLASNEPNLMKELSDSFEKTVLSAALAVTNGRRVEASVKLGIGRNTMTRKIQELNIDEKSMAR